MSWKALLIGLALGVVIYSLVGMRALQGGLLVLR